MTPNLIRLFDWRLSRETIYRLFSLQPRLFLQASVRFFGSTALDRQDCTELQPDYYMKYCMRGELASLVLAGHYAPARPRNTTTARPRRTISSSLKRPTRVRSLER